MPEKDEGVLISSREIEPPESKKAQKCEFASYIDEMAKELFIKRRDIAEWTGIDPERFRKIVNRTNPTKKRDCIIACGFALRLDCGETSDALFMYDFPRLDDGLKREEYICALLDEQEKKQRSLAEVNACLRAMGYSELDIIDHRSGKKKEKNNRKPSRYINRGVRVECRLDEQVFGDQYNSLITEYSPDRYRVIAKIGLTDSWTEQDFELIAEPTGYYSRIDYPIISAECLHSYKTLEETGNLRPYFETIQSYARQELAKKAKVLKNTRNYRDRISACVIDNTASPAMPTCGVSAQTSRARPAAATSVFPSASPQRWTATPCTCLKAPSICYPMPRSASRRAWTGRAITWYRWPGSTAHGQNCGKAPCRWR